MKQQRAERRRLTTRLLMPLCVAVLAGSAVSARADDGTGFDPRDTRGGQELHRVVFDWEGTQLEEHPDFVEDFGFDACVGCHLLEGQGYVNERAPGCLSCHEAEWDEDDDITPVLSDGAAWHTRIFGWLDPREMHQEYVDDEGVAACIGCHRRDGTEDDLEWGGKMMASSFSAPGCLTCHDKEWDDERDRDDDDDDDDDRDRDRDDDDDEERERD